MSGQSAHNKTECDIAWYITFKVDIYHIDIYLIPTGIYHWMVYTKTPNHMVYTMVYIKKRSDIQWYITHCISHGISHSVLTCCWDVVYHGFLYIYHGIYHVFCIYHGIYHGIWRFDLLLGCGTSRFFMVYIDFSRDILGRPWVYTCIYRSISQCHITKVCYTSAKVWYVRWPFVI